MALLFTPVYHGENDVTRVARGGVPTGTERYLKEHRHELYEAWWEEAACSGGDTNAWFGERRGPSSDDTKLALSICGGCPVKDECLAWAMRVGEHYGIFGGLFPDERHALTKAAREITV